MQDTLLIHTSKIQLSFTTTQLTAKAKIEL